MTPALLTAGESATLRWQVEGARAVFLNDQEVTPQGERVVTPQRTTGYRLHIEFYDQSFKDLDALAIVDARTRTARAAASAASRPASVVLDAANITRLRSYPRPPKDNGIGLHFHLDLRDEFIAQTVENLNPSVLPGH